MIARTTPVAVLLVATIGAWSTPVAGQEVPLAKAVKEFNEKAKENPIGKGQPALTEDEVVAAIRGWIRERIEASDEVYATYQKIAHTGVLPPGAHLSYTTGWRNFNGFDFDVWWVDLTIWVAKDRGYTFRIRDQKLSSRPAKK